MNTAPDLTYWYNLVPTSNDPLPTDVLAAMKDNIEARRAVIAELNDKTVPMRRKSPGYGEQAKMRKGEHDREENIGSDDPPTDDGGFPEFSALVRSIRVFRLTPSFEHDLAAYHRWVRPILDVPDEILGRIFEESLPDPLCGCGCSYIGRNHPSVVLSHVCQRWREIALATGSLWSAPSVQLGHASTDPRCIPVLQVMSAWKEWVRRSGMRSLHVSISHLPVASRAPPVQQDLWLLVKVLTQSCDRWRTLSLTLDVATRGAADLLEILRIPGKRLPRLVVARVLVYMRPGIYLTPDEHLVFRRSPLSDAPSLAALESTIWGPANALVPLGWDVKARPALQTLKTPPYQGMEAGIHPADMVALLCSASNLVVCDLYISLGRWTEDLVRHSSRTGGKLRLPNLTGMVLRGSVSGHDIANFFDVPSLVDLSFLDIGHSPTSQYSPLDCLQRIGPQLQTFECDPVLISNPIDLARALSHLTHIHSFSLPLQAKLGVEVILDESFLGDLLQQLSTRTSEYPHYYCPLLRSIVCGRVRVSQMGTRFLQGAFEEFLLRRCAREGPAPGVIAVREVTMCVFSESVANDEGAGLSALKAKGMVLDQVRLNLCYHPLGATQ